MSWLMSNIVMLSERKKTKPSGAPTAMMLAQLDPPYAMKDMYSQKGQ